ANLHSCIRPTWTLGLSATPYRTDRIKLCFDQVIRDAGIAALISDGYLSAYHHYTIPEHTPQRIANLLLSDPQRWGKSLVFFHRRNECDLLYLLLRQAGVSCEVVTASSNRERQIEDFAAGRVQVLINMAILTEGFDCPELQTVFCRPSGKGCTIQMAGRVLRTCHHVPVKQIVQCQKTPYPMLRTAMPAEQYLWSDDQWRSIRANKRLNEMTQIARKRVARAEVKLPKLVAIHRSRATSAWYSRAE
ncbi:MAG: helicase, partial [Pirellulaceae bacterium]|nr:helicase [Pirellulaceae bacterium]